MVSKEEAEVAKVIAKETKRSVPVNQGSFTGRTRKAPYQRLAPIAVLDNLQRGSFVCDISRDFARTSVKDCVISESVCFEMEFWIVFVFCNCQ